MERQGNRAYILIGCRCRFFVSDIILYRGLEAHARVFRNRQSSLSPLTPFLSLPRYFDSEWSYAQYRIPTQTSHIALNAGPNFSDVVDDERCVVAWIKVSTQPATGSPATVPESEYQLIALTYSGGWYRLGLPNSAQAQAGKAGASSKGTSSAASHVGRSSPLAMHRSSSGSSVTGRTRADKGKDKETDREGKDGHECSLLEFRRYGRWDGWG